MLRFALAEHKASCAFGEAGFVPSHTLARTPPARAVASSLKAEAIGPAEKARAGFTTAKAELESARDWVRQQEAAAQAQWADLRSIAAGTAARRSGASSRTCGSGPRGRGWP